MKVIGLCGGSGSGKGTVCSIFSKLSIPSIDTDKLYHEIISTDSECTAELVSVFGDGIRAYPGINRAALRDVVFASHDNLKRLNEITHKHILTEVRRIIKKTRDADGIIIDAPLLFESGFDKECDVIVSVIADDSVRLARIIARDGISEEAARRRMGSQIPNGELIERSDFWIENSSTEKELEQQVTELRKKLFNN